MSSSFAAIVGGAVGAFVLLGIVIGILWFFLLHCNKSSNNNSDTGSSDPSAVVEFKRVGGPSSSSISQPFSGPPHEARQFKMEELEQATKHFDETNLIGYGSFGLVYKGLLRDGTVAGLVVIKRRTGAPRQEFIDEVSNMSRIWHRHLVTLLGYCQDKGYQMLVYEYLPNGSMCNHLYDTRKDPTAKLEFRQRLSIALAAAKGLCHLHSQQPPTTHNDFKTANVLVDEDFIAKVADAGLQRLLERIEEAGPSRSTRENVFEDPEVGRLGVYSERSDVYSFGVFLLELITGQEASQFDCFGSDGSMLQWVETHLSSDDLVDRRLVGSFTAEGMKDFLRLTLRCLSFPGIRRPNMEMVMSELDGILEKEIMLKIVTGEGTATVTLGSHLFTLN